MPEREKRDWNVQLQGRLPLSRAIREIDSSRLKRAGPECARGRPLDDNLSRLRLITTQHKIPQRAEQLNIKRSLDSVQECAAQDTRFRSQMQLCNESHENRGTEREKEGEREGEEEAGPNPKRGSCGFDFIYDAMQSAGNW